MSAFLIKSRNVVLPDRVASGAVHIQGEKIAGFIPDGQALPDVPVEEAGDLWVLPGLVDTHVHINEPGRTEWEGFESATAAAAAGGITTLVDMPLNSDPVTVSMAALDEKINAAEGKLSVDCGFHAGIVPGVMPELEKLIEAGVIGAKAFMTYSGIPEFPASDIRLLHEVMPVLAKHRVPLLVHAELESPVDLPGGRNDSYRRYLASRPPKWEVDAIGLLVAACRDTGCHVHIVHLTCADALPLLESAKAEGLPVTVETCPHYLHFAAEGIPDGATHFKCAPPIRSEKHREALWRALVQDGIDMVASDHSPCPPEMKARESGDFFKAWGGISSLQLGFSVMNTECRDRGLGLEQLARWMSSEPAQIFGMYPVKGLIAAGADADVIIVDPVKPFKVAADQLLHKNKITPYEDETLVGTVQKTYLRGRCVFDLNGEMFTEPVESGEDNPVTARVFSIELVTPKIKTARGQSFKQLIRGFYSQQSRMNGVDGIQHDTDGDGVAMADFVIRH